MRYANTLISEDIILIQLNPTEEYKSSVLAGLKPEIILDISMRAIAFYEYQTSQEIAFRSMIQKNIQEKYKMLKDQFNIATRDFTHINKVEKEKTMALMKDFEMEKLKSQQFAAKFEEKSKQFQKLQQAMYEKLKRKTINPTMQDAFTASPPPVTSIPPPTNQHHAISAPIAPYLSNSSNKAIRLQRNNGSGEDDLMSRIGRASNITGARSVFVPPQRPSPPVPSHHARNHHGYNKPTRIPSPSVAAGSSLFSYRHHHPRRDSNGLRNQMPPTTITASETIGFVRHRQQQQHDQQQQSYRQEATQMEPTASHYYHKFVDSSRHKH
ncbi:hypothetical protein [Parasitella parasitica]|uniref:Uncharacterized protein n=1 Tax=Parasitella parasitica TaxID=35722 RepID=A0A0B7N9U8_9FUNG|nr:hypothetical protein [Parasitella parasitica]